MFGDESRRSKNQKDIHVNSDSHLLLRPSFVNLPITNGIDNFFKHPFREYCNELWVTN